MPPADSSALIVARFLKTNHYMESYEAFIREAGLPINAGDVRKNDLTLETLLEEKKMFDVSVRFEKLGTENEANSWSEPAPEQENAVTTLPSKANLLSTSVETFLDDSNALRPVFLATSADRRLHILTVPSCRLKNSLPALQDSPILSCAVFQERVLLTTAMSGQLMASDLEGNRLDSRRDHSKYVVRVAVYRDNDQSLIATAGWDNKLLVYKPSLSTSAEFQLGPPISTVTLQTKPEAFLFLKHPESHEPIVLVSRTDSSHIFYYTTEPQPRLLGKQNLAPHSNAWVAFTPSSLALCPTDPSLLAVGTNSVPHMKLLIVRLLVPPFHAPSAAPRQTIRSSLLDDTPATETQASQARAALAIADREAAAIQIHCTTMAPQTPFSTPAVAWRPDGTGVWVNGDDGAVRGIETSTGKVVCTLQGHEEGSKVRCLWAGWVGSELDEEDGAVEDGVKEKQEWMISGGFDHRLIVWKAKPKGVATDR